MFQRTFVAFCGLLILVSAPGFAQTSAVVPDARAANASATDSLATQLLPNAPGRYVIKQGDTLWAISTLYLKSPWRWPELWMMNQADIKNPHLIYPGQVLALSFDANGRPRLGLENGRSGEFEQRPVVKLSPTLRYDAIARDLAVPSIPPAELEPFLSRPLVIDAELFAESPSIVVADEKRVILAKGDVAYVMPLKEGQPRDWHVYRSTGELRDPRWKPTPWWTRSDWFDGKPQKDLGLLGYEAKYLGDARVVQFGDVSKIEIVSSKEEIIVGDKLVMAPVPEKMSYVPRPPTNKVDSIVIKLTDSVAEVGRGSVVSIAAGKADGMEIGHVVALVRPAKTVPNPRYVRPRIFTVPGMTDLNPSKEPEFFTLPEERIGLGFVFRTFDRVSYMYILSSSAMVRVGDFVRNP